MKSSRSGQRGRGLKRLEDQPQRILVAGASGIIGSALSSELNRRGFWIRALTRDAKSIHSDFNEVFVGDLMDPATLRGACDRIDLVVSCAGAPRKSSRLWTGGKATFTQVDDFGNRNLLREAITANVTRFVYLSAFGGRVMGMNEYIRAHENFASILRSTRTVHSIVVRPTVTFHSVSQMLDDANAGKLRIIGNGEARVNPIHEAELAEVIVGAFDKESSDLDVGGPQTFTYRELGELVRELIPASDPIKFDPQWIANLKMSLHRFKGRHNNHWRRFVTVSAVTDLIAPPHGRSLLKDYLMNHAETRGIKTKST